MDDFLKTLLIGSQGWAAYGSIFGILVACGLGMPLPEDVSLILGGFLVYRGSANLMLMVATGFLGILTGDSIIFFAGRRMGDRARAEHGRFLRRLLTPARRARVEELFSRHGEKIVMAARFMPGVRAVTFFTAGSAGMPYARFICFDGLAALASAPAFVFLGFRFGRQLQRVIELLKRFQIATAAGIVLGVLVWLAVRRWREARAARLASHPGPSVAAEQPAAPGAGAGADRASS
ncbi:MAG TPA: DedA family protein [Myxococcaceae bacterium]|nr:DedA family protein [Myxococcaceae bacterium]